MNVSHNNPQAWLDRLYETAIAYQKGHSVQRDRSRTEAEADIADLVSIGILREDRSTRHISYSLETEAL